MQQDTVLVVPVVPVPVADTTRVQDRSVGLMVGLALLVGILMGWGAFAVRMSGRK